MSYNFKRLTDVETINVIPDDAEIFCVVDDEIKKVSKNVFASKKDEDVPSVSSNCLGNAVLRFFDRENEEEPIVEEFTWEELRSEVEKIANTRNYYTIKNELYKFCVFNNSNFQGRFLVQLGEESEIDKDGNIISGDIFDNQGLLCISLIENKIIIEGDFWDYTPTEDELAMISFKRITLPYIEETGIVGIYEELNEETNEFFLTFVLKDDYFNKVLDVYSSGGNICFREPGGSTYRIIDTSYGNLLSIANQFINSDKYYDYLFLSYEEKDVQQVDMYSFITQCGGNVPDEGIEFLQNIFIDTYFLSGHFEISIVPQSLADYWGVDYDFIFRDDK